MSAHAMCCEKGVLKTVMECPDHGVDCERKKLWEKLADKHFSTPHYQLEQACSRPIRKGDFEAFWSVIATTAIQTFKEVIRDFPMSPFSKDELTRRLDELQ